MTTNLNGTEDSDVAMMASRELWALHALRTSRTSHALWELWELRVSRVSQELWEDTRPIQETAKIQSDKLVEIVNS